MIPATLQRLGLQTVFIVLAVLLSVFTVSLILEKSLVKQALELEADAFIDSYQADKSFPLPRTRNLIGYLSTPGAPAIIPTELAILVPGLYTKVSVSGRVKRIPVYVRDFDGNRLYLIFEGANIDRLVGVFGLLPLSILLIVIYTSSWIAYKLSWRAVSPILKIARYVRKTGPEDLALDLSSKNLTGETKELVEALDEYAKRIDVFVKRERQFTADVSHELRTPMTIIDGAAQFLEIESNITKKGLERVKMIRRACHDVNDLTSAFFLMARDQQQQLPRELISVSQLVEQEILKLDPLVDTEKVRVNVEILDDFKVRTNKTALEIIIGNIYSNAVKYTEEGQIGVKVTKNQIFISDTGIGIPEELLPHLFERHVRGRGLNQAGEGLGLAIVKRLCDQFNWGIAIHNRSEKGIVVKLTKHENTGET
jgi:signal transduction histidine kinase